MKLGLKICIKLLELRLKMSEYPEYTEYPAEIGMNVAADLVSLQFRTCEFIEFTLN